MARRPKLPLVRKSITLNQAELERVKRILGAATDSEAIRRLIRDRLAMEGAARAHERILRGRPIELVRWK